ncbi:hypothetical protein LWI28_007339 [Acer negundo]|uniref:Uncharacterized protein n=1 Tax=Acer negundo TaxID=4023 RepID=A0AAD5J3H7_ACENE|nr:hypothetical protein LWI28_007339 [Acer negundo]
MRSIVLPLILCIVLFNLFAGTQAEGPVWRQRTEKFKGNTCTSGQCLLDFLGRLGAGTPELTNFSAKKVVGSKKDVRIGSLMGGRGTVIEDEDRGRRFTESISMKECEEAVINSKNVHVADRPLEGEVREFLEINDGEVPFSKGKTVAFIKKMAPLSSKTSGKSKLIIGRMNNRCHLLESSSEDSLDFVSSDEDVLGLHKDRGGPLYDGKCHSGPSNGGKNLKASSKDQINYRLNHKIGDREPIDCMDPIADCLAAKSPLGQSSLHSYKLYMDLGSGIKVVNTSQNNLLLSNSCDEEETNGVEKQKRKTNFKELKEEAGEEKELSYRQVTME